MTDTSSTIIDMVKTLPFNEAQVREIIRNYPTPFYLYDERGIRENARRLNAAFAWCPGFKEHFAVKALPNPYILKIAKEEGFGADCSSLPELLLAERVGITGENIMFTSNDTPLNEFQQAKALGAVINLDDITHLRYVEEHTGGLPELISFRYNPGSLRTGNSIIGDPANAKYGLTTAQLFQGYALAKKGVKRFALHTMIGSNELNLSYFIDTAKMLFEMAIALSEALDIRLEFVNLGGGIGIPYMPEQDAIDFEELGQAVKKHYDEIIRPTKLNGLQLRMENGRCITGPYGFLVTRVIHEKHTYKDYVGVDACMANLMRPAMYRDNKDKNNKAPGYHHITVLGKEQAPADTKVDVVGSLCENNDKFAVDRMLPQVKIDDILVIHDAGAHGHSMGFQYNGKLRCAELLLREDGSVQQIRRAETIDDYFATLDFSKL
jgi:diaminopimelate decarboxylase